MSTLDDIDLPLPGRTEGKVRVSYDWSPTERLFVTTDRLSAFDRIITSVPCKGQVLNQLSAWWFERTAHIVPNHLLEVPDPNVTIAHAAVPLPVEVVVRGHITGVTSTSLWRQYAGGARVVYGHRLPDGITKNSALPTPLVTPTTKAAKGGHDEPITVAGVVERRLVEPRLWGRDVEAALQLFAEGRRVAADAGLVLAATKSEYGRAVDTGELMLIDDVHTPDSSRYWVADTYAARVGAGDEPESLDKEVVRRALLELGYAGEGPPPVLAPEVIAATTARYSDTYERLTGLAFVPAEQPAAERIRRVITARRTS
ncbi:MAG: phosphoribosylaminoimidazole-succinocarboxamide synthase [Actinomycetota bacterium]